MRHGPRHLRQGPPGYHSVATGTMDALLDWPGERHLLQFGVPSDDIRKKAARLGRPFFPSSMTESTAQRVRLMNPLISRFSLVDSEYNTTR